MEMSETFEEAVKRIDKRLSKLEKNIKDFNKVLDEVYEQNKDVLDGLREK
jgi:prefoldin subunit 5